MQNNTTTKPLNQNKMNAKLYKTEKENYVLVDPTKGTYDDGYTLGTSRESQYNKLSIKNCQAIECGYDLDELACNEIGIDISVINHIDNKVIENDSVSTPIHEAGALGAGLYHRVKGFEIGFQKALEVNADKRFTLKEMVECWNRALEFQTHKETLGEYIKSLQQTEWDVEVVMQKIKDETKIIGSVKGVKGSGSKITTYKSVPKLDADGCLILRRMSPDSSN